MSNTEMQTCFCLEELEAGKTQLIKLANELDEEYPIYLEHRGSGSGEEYSDILQLHLTAKTLWEEIPKLLHSLRNTVTRSLLKPRKKCPMQ